MGRGLGAGDPCQWHGKPKEPTNLGGDDFIGDRVAMHAANRFSRCKQRHLLWLIYPTSVGMTGYRRETIPKRNML